MLLHWAGLQAQRQTVKWLIGQGAHPDRANRYGLQTAQGLAELVADLQATNQRGKKPGGLGQDSRTYRSGRFVEKPGR